ncbi:MAG: tetratricopeptide repeat protein [Flavobacteriales bacterium]|nr:tetratricopeptide repeat protein [Flavobacteriales bacterium]
MKKFNLFLICIYFSLTVKSQDKEIDSLWNYVNTAKEDSNMVYTYQTLGFRCGWQKGNYDTAIALVNKAVELSKKINYKDGLASSYNKLGIAFYERSDYPKAIDYYYKALAINEVMGNKYGRASNIGNIGIIYQDMNEFDKALNFYFLALSIHKEVGDIEGQAANLGNIGIVFYLKFDHSNALKYYNKALKLNIDAKNSTGQAINLGNIGMVYSELNEKEKALTYFKDALRINKENNDKYGQADQLTNIGILYSDLKQYAQAEYYIKQAIDLQIEIESLNELKHSYEGLSDVYLKTNRHKEALEIYKKFISVRDSINNIENTKATIQKELQFNYEKKATADSVRVAQEKKIVTSQLEKEKTQRTALYLGLILVGVFSLFMAQRYRVTNKQKKIIEQKEQETQKQNLVISQQKELIEIRHKEITDSINYAERIQHALLASKKILDENLQEYFIFFKPKDVVSGDFYWATTLNNRNFALMCADSTGHGVPGAIMSILNIACLKETSLLGITSPDLFLNEARKLVIENLKNDGSPDGGKDGMDGSLLCFDFVNKKLECANANNPVLIVRNHELIEIKADRFPIGKHDRDKEPFTLHTIQLQEGDMIYTFTDGFADQFGGVQGKKFKYKKLQELLIQISKETMADQKLKLNNTFNEWKGNLEQVDDVTIFGVKI